MDLLTKDMKRNDVDEEDIAAPGGDHVEVGQRAQGRPVDVARLHRLGTVQGVDTKYFRFGLIKIFGRKKF